MQHTSITPAPGRRVRDEAGNLVEGQRTVPRTPFWNRLIAEGDVVEAPPATPEKKDR